MGDLRNFSVYGDIALITPISIFPHQGGRDKRGDALTSILSHPGRGGKRVGDADYAKVSRMGEEVRRRWTPAYAGER